MTREESGAVMPMRARTEVAPPSAPRNTSSVATSPVHDGVANAPRQPRQERGERRVSAILDAAASLIVECGAEGLTVQALAERANTSKGSLYHFFPDLQSVLRALADRHRAAISEITQGMIADSTIDWAALSPQETVTRFLAPLRYLETHPDLLALARAPNMLDGTTRRLAPLCDLADHILRRRYPRLGAEDRLLRTSTMVALMDGVVGYSLRSGEVDPAGMVGELHRALAAYLVAHESDVNRIHA